MTGSMDKRDEQLPSVDSSLPSQGGAGKAGEVEPTQTLTWTAEEERTLVRKLDWNVMPLLWALFMLSFLDRSNIGNANTAGMSKDLGMSDDQYQWLLTIFYISYSLGQPTMLLWKIIPPHMLVACLTFIWAILQPTAHWGGLMALRFLLGLAETAFSPGVTFFLTFFYNRREVGLRQGLYAGAASIASCYAGALAYGITQIKNSSIAVWKILFLIEGAPAILMVPVAYFFLADRPSKARFLTEREKDIAVARTARDGKTGREEGLKMKGVWQGFGDPKAYLCALVYFSLNVSYSSLPVFLPTILADMGFSSLRAQGLSAPPYLAAFIVITSACWASDRIGDRSIFMIPLALIGMAGYLILALAKATAVRYFAVYLCAVGIFPVIGLMLPFTASMHEDDSKRGAGFLILNLIGQCGPFLGTRLYPKTESPYYVKGMAVSCAFMGFAAVLILILRFLLVWENRRRDRLYGYFDPKVAYRAPLGSPAGNVEEGGSVLSATAPAKLAEQEGRQGQGTEKEEGVNKEWRFLL
ncbi:hypothetical protein JCM8547_006926 [Rhodosporidiobolus lusitaniae]